MTPSISVKVDIDRARAQLLLTQREIDKAAQMALNRTAQKTSTQAVRTISRETGLKPSRVRKAIRIKRASSRYRLIAEVLAFPFAPNLIEFAARQTRAGVSANAWGKRKIYPRTFIIRRWNKVYKRLTKKRFPLKSIRGPSVPKTFASRIIQAAMRQVVRTEFPKEFASALRALGVGRR
ncbi:MAG: phage tail protein [Steroidobacteraceae bacterium]|nr:phage tail protein [Steroidobacteraceae bacterium]MDW8260852.1 phage tail protein [Gammaproteobacteria bacterium]